MARDSRSPEYEAMIKLTAKLVTVMKLNLVDIANKMLAKGIIVEADHEKVVASDTTMSKTEKATYLVSSIKEQVKLNPKIFEDIVAILKEDSHLEDICKQLLEIRNELQDHSAKVTPAIDLCDGVALPTCTRTLCIWMFLPLLVIVVAIVMTWSVPIFQKVDQNNINTVRLGKDMPIKMYSSPHAVLVNASVYIGGGAASREKDMLAVMVYDIQLDRWNTLKPYFCKKFSMAIMNNTLIVVGGVTVQKDVTNVIGMWDNQHNAWTHPLPPMTIPCHSPTVVAYNNTWLIVAGGNKRDRNELSRVEILDTTTNQWYSGAPLPATCSHVTSAVIGNIWYLLGGYMDNSYLKRVFSVNLDDLIDQALSFQSIRSAPSLWQTLPADTPLLFSTALAYKGALLTVGGELENGEQSADIHMYHPNKNTWVKIGEMQKKRSHCTAVVLPCGSEIFVTAGGGYYTSTVDTSVVEILKSLPAQTY